MISYINGELAAVHQDGAIIELGGIGYEVKMPISALDDLPPIGTMVKIHTYLHVREDILALFGFLSVDDLEIFRLLITVNGIGPKGALGILSVITPDELRFAVLSDDVKTISKAPGVGSKTARKLILELKDKFKLEEAFETRLENEGFNKGAKSSSVTDIRKETIEALVVLGYSRTDSAKVVRKIDITDTMTSEDLLKMCLKALV